MEYSSVISSGAGKYPSHGYGHGWETPWNEPGNWNEPCWNIRGYPYPIGSMYGKYANIWGILMVNGTPLIWHTCGSVMGNIWGFPARHGGTPKTKTDGMETPTDRGVGAWAAELLGVVRHVALHCASGWQASKLGASRELACWTFFFQEVEANNRKWRNGKLPMGELWIQKPGICYDIWYTPKLCN